MGKFYAVKEGKKPGIYTSWAECERQVKGYSGAKFKSFLSKSEAEAYMFVNHDEENLEEKSDLEIYVDGSYSKTMYKAGYGCVIIYKGDVIERVSKSIPINDEENLWNVSAEIAAVIYAVNWAINNKYQSIDLYYDYEGLEKWYTGEWSAKKNTTKQYVKTLKALDKKIKLNFLKVKSHSGNEYNELADQLAKMSLELGHDDEIVEEIPDDKNVNDCIFITQNEYYEIVGLAKNSEVEVITKGFSINDASLIKIAKYLWKKENKKISDLDCEIKMQTEEMKISFRLKDKKTDFILHKYVQLKGEE